MNVSKTSGIGIEIEIFEMTGIILVIETFQRYWNWVFKLPELKLGFQIARIGIGIEGFQITGIGIGPNPALYLYCTATI